MYHPAEGSGVSSLSLEERSGAAAPSGLAPVLTHRPRSAWSDSDHAGSPSPRNTGSANGRSPRFAGMEYYAGDSDDGDDDGGAGRGGGDGVKVEKKRRFREARKTHYKMSDALAKAKELLEEETAVGGGGGGGGVPPEEAMLQAEGLNGTVG